MIGLNYYYLFYEKFLYVDQKSGFSSLIKKIESTNLIVISKFFIVLGLFSLIFKFKF